MNDPSELLFTVSAIKLGARNRYWGVDADGQMQGAYEDELRIAPSDLTLPQK